MKVKIHSWIVRGVNDSKKSSLRISLGLKGLTWVCLQETKIQGMNKALVHSIGVGRFLD